MAGKEHNEVVLSAATFQPVVAALARESQAEGVLQLIVDTLTELFRCQTCAIVLSEKMEDIFRVRNNYGLSYEFTKAFRRQFKTGLIAQLLFTGDPIVIEDSRANPDQAESIRLEYPFISAACVRLMVDHQPMGYLQMDFDHEFRFNPGDMSLLQIFADLAAVAVHKERLSDAVVRLDPLDLETGLPKFSAFVKTVEEHIQLAREFGQHLGVMMLDVDSFRRIVNVYGTRISDTLVVDLGQFIRGKLRSVDVVSRWGLDEFAVLLPNVSYREAKGHAERLRASVEKHSFTEEKIQCTISIGLVYYPYHGAAVDSLLSSSSIALYEAQRTGRNVVVTLKGPREIIRTQRADLIR